MDFIRNAIQAVWNVLQSIGIIDIVDILLLAYLVYTLLKLIRETRAGQLMKGVLLLVVVYLISDFVGLKSISFISEKALNVGFLAIVILFQPELRRALEKFGRSAFHVSMLNMGDDGDATVRWNQAIPAICDAVQELSATNTGALIVIERATRLGEQISTGTVLKALPSREVFGNIFYPKTPLHDGAVIMRDGIILAAACFLPKPQKEELVDKHLGSRHRAAIGMSENSDAIVIVVSEETGQISIAENGTLTRDYTRASLEQLLRNALLPAEDTQWRSKTMRLPFRREKSAERGKKKTDLPSVTVGESQTPEKKEEL